MSGGDKDAGEIRFLGDLQRLEIRPGDVFVLTCDSAISRDQEEALLARWREAARGAPLVILDRGARLGVAGSSVQVACDREVAAITGAPDRRPHALSRSDQVADLTRASALLRSLLLAGGKVPDAETVRLAIGEALGLIEGCSAAHLSAIRREFADRYTGR